MFDRILSLFHPQAPVTKLPEADAQHALGALLVRAAKADKAYLFEEIEHIDDLLAHRYGLNPVEAAKLRAESEKLEEAMPDTTALARNAKRPGVAPRPSGIWMASVRGCDECTTQIG